MSPDQLRFFDSSPLGDTTKLRSPRSMHFQPIIFEEDDEDDLEVAGMQPGDSGNLDVAKPSERLSLAPSGGSMSSAASGSMGRKRSGPARANSAAAPPGDWKFTLVSFPQL